MMRSNLKNAKGFTIIELIITIAILSFGVIGVYNAFSSIYTLTYGISNRFIAAYLVQEGIEIVRNIRDTNYIKINNPQNQGWQWLSGGLKNCELGCQADYKTGTSAEDSLSQLKAYDDNTYLSLSSDGFYNYNSGSATIFKRKITINVDPKDIAKVTVLVSWSYNNQSYSLEAQEYIYDWFASF